MASPAVINAVEARLEAGFTAASVYLPNHKLPSAGPYVAVQFPLASELQATIGAPGGNVFREEGVIRFMIVVRSGSGLDTLGTIATQLRDLFRNARFDGVRCYAPTTPVFDDRSDEGGSFRGSLAVPYEFDLYA